jgi:hypothetical protein
MIARFLLLPSAAIALFTTFAGETAFGLSYTISGGSVSAANSGDGLLLQTSLNFPAITPFTFSLNDGQSYSFNFFDIWTMESTVNPDDEIKRAISATLSFSDPVTSATIGGITVGGSFLKGLTQWGEVKWNNLDPLNVGGRTFRISLTDEVFNAGLFGLNDGPHYGATVRATVEQIGTSAVPDGGSTAMLLGLSLLGIGLVSRKRIART